MSFRGGWLLQLRIRYLGHHHSYLTGGQGGQPGQLGKALIHLLGGILCVHIHGTELMVKYLFDINT